MRSKLISPSFGTFEQASRQARWNVSDAGISVSLMSGDDGGSWAPSLTRAQAVAHTAMVRALKQRSRAYRLEHMSDQKVGQWK